MKMKSLLCGLLVGLLPLATFAQTDSLKQNQTEEFEDYSSYGDDSSVKRYCTQKVQFLSPTKLISLGYESQLAHKLETPAHSLHGQNYAADNSDVSMSHGLRLGFNTPLISRSKLIVNFGMSYYESRFSFAEPDQITHPLHKSLKEYGLRTTGAMLTVFKPLNEKNFIIAAVNGDLNGTYNFSNIPSLGKMTYSVLGVYGWKRSDKKMWGLGVARTYRVGEVNYVPVLLYNQTFNDKWGVELLLPARGAVRRNFSAKSLLMFGYELEGNSYLVSPSSGATGSFTHFDDMRLRRSELKVRFTYEKSLHNFIWLSVQAGLRTNIAFNVSEKETSPRREYLFTNSLTNPLYFAISLNLVSP